MFIKTAQQPENRFLTIPYTKGIAEKIRRVSRKFNI